MRYDKVLHGVPDRYKEKARLVLMSIAYAKRPLRLHELAVIARLPEPSDVLRICTSSLVRLAPVPWESNMNVMLRERQVAILDHFSVKEYLLSDTLMQPKRGAASYFYVPPILAHLSLSRTLVLYLLENERLQSQGESLDKVLTYAAHWYRHFQDADSIEAADTLELGVSKSQIATLRADIYLIFCEGASQNLGNWLYLMEFELSGIYGFDFSGYLWGAHPLKMLACITTPSSTCLII